MSPGWFEGDSRIESLPLDDRGLHYGDGLFETIAIRNGQPRLWRLHVERLQIGAERLGISLPTESNLRQWLKNAIEQSGVSDRAIGKIIVTRGSGRRGYRIDDHARPRTVLGIFESPSYPLGNWTHGVKIRLCSTPLGSQPTLAGIKSLNRLEQVLARNEWTDPSVAEGLMLDANGDVVCGTMSNLFIVSAKRLVTPALTTAGVCGVMRRHIIAQCEKFEMSVTAEQVSVDALRTCDELFVCNSQIGLWPVYQCSGSTFESPGPVTSQVMKLLVESGITES